MVGSTIKSYIIIELIYIISELVLLHVISRFSPLMNADWLIFVPIEKMIISLQP